jgi:hypothetical protein
MTLFGPLVHGGVVENAVKDALVDWLPTYLREVERQHDRAQGSLPSPRSYQLVSEADDPTRWPEDQIPAIVIMCPGFAEEPYHEGTGFYRARYGVSVAAMVSANTQGATRQLARLYGTALAAALLQHPSLDGFASGLRWVDESYDDIPSETSRSLACVIEGFTVDVDRVISTNAGPVAPDASESETSPEWPVVEETEVNLVSETGPLPTGPLPTGPVDWSLDNA